MAPDQRYCLECGARAHLGSALLDRLRASASSSPCGERPGGVPGAQSTAIESATALASAAPGAHVRPNGTPAVIAGVGVLVLALGVGILIGRAGLGGGRVATAPAQVISVASPGTGTAATATTQTPTPAAPTQSSKHKPGKSPSSGVGSSLSKPAPPTALQNLRTGGSGQSYEQKSKNLPNVVSTG